MVTVLQFSLDCSIPWVCTQLEIYDLNKILIVLSQISHWLFIFRCALAVLLTACFCNFNFDSNYLRETYFVSSYFVTALCKHFIVNISSFDVHFFVISRSLHCICCLFFATEDWMWLTSSMLILRCFASKHIRGVICKLCQTTVGVGVCMWMVCTYAFIRLSQYSGKLHNSWLW